VARGTSPEIQQSSHPWRLVPAAESTPGDRSLRSLIVARLPRRPPQCGGPGRSRLHEQCSCSPAATAAHPAELRARRSAILQRAAVHGAWNQPRDSTEQPSLALGSCRGINAGRWRVG